MSAVLGIDTATAQLSVAITAGEELLCERTVEPGGTGRPRHAQELLLAVEDVLASAGGWDRVGRIAVGVGPGTFTGLRIGIATARGLAQARNVDLAGVSSLGALAAGCVREGPVLAVLDAKRNEAFAALYEGETEVWAPFVCPPGDLGERVRKELRGVIAVGDGAVRFRDELDASGAEIPPDEDGVHRLRARHVCLLAAKAEARPLAEIKPTYLRRPDAELWRERDRGTNPRDR